MEKYAVSASVSTLRDERSLAGRDKLL